jgi:methylenetetrahydrofolate--tRNA-(uracil-5-)-methyltransferase
VSPSVESFFPDASQQNRPIHIIGAGLAGSEAALQLADRGFRVTLYDIKPERRSAAHHSGQLAEIVCSNSLGSQYSGEDVSASGLLKEEMTQMGSCLLAIAREAAVPAGKALAVDREQFSALVTERVQNHANITFICDDITALPDDPQALVLIATGPLTSEGLAASLSQLLEREQLYFFDAAAPIVARDSIDFSIAFMQDRYELEPKRPRKNKFARKGDATSETVETAASDSQTVNAETTIDDTADSNTPVEAKGSYINCPLEKADYEALCQALLEGEKTELKSFEKEAARYFESCLPVEVLASRGLETLRFGPMKPVGLMDPRTGRRPYAVVQLRQDNAEGTLYNLVGFQTNLKWGAQKEMIRLIPGLAQAEVVRYGVMHRNTFIHSPEVLQPTLQLKKHADVLIAGQLTGTEGYTESIASGLLAAFNLAQLATGQSTSVPPATTMLGSLMRYITRPEAIGQTFQPINSNWGIMPELPEGSFPRKDKKARNRLYRDRSMDDLGQWLTTHAEAGNKIPV